MHRLFRQQVLNALLLSSFLLGKMEARAQFTDSLNLDAGTIITAASEDYQPLWNTSNKWGVITDQQVDASSFIRASNKLRLWTPGGRNTKDSLQKTRSAVQLLYGVSLYFNDHFGKVFFQEGYAKLRYKSWQLAIGRFEENLTGYDPKYTLGSFGVSANSLPIPKLSFSVIDYTNVPFTNGWLQFKGSFSHGWMGNNRYMQNPFYHEKSFYLQLGKKKLQLYGGIEHFAEWGGRRGSFILDRSFNGFIDVIMVKEADDGSVGTSINGILPNRAGDQRGLINLGFKWNNSKVGINGYTQMFFESGEEIDTRNRSGLIGLGLVFKQKQILNRLNFEILYTKEMNDFVPSHQRQSYYNNGAYRTGWEYEQRVVGLPVFTNRERANKYFPNITPYNWSDLSQQYPGNMNIINNRLFTFHTSAGYTFSKSLSGRTLITYTKNYGDSDVSPFYNKTATYTLNEVTFQPPKKKFGILIGVGADFGDLSKSIGLIAGFNYRFFGNRKL